MNSNKVRVGSCILAGDMDTMVRFYVPPKRMNQSFELALWLPSYAKTRNMVFIAAFIGLFQGTEYSDGTMRNKLIVGHSRIKIYLANFLTNYIASAIVVFAGFLVGMVGVPALGWLEMETSAVMSYFAASLLMA